MHVRRRSQAFVAAAVVATIVANASASITRSAQPFVGVTQYQFIQTATDNTTPIYTRPVVVNVLKIDTQASGIHFQMQGGNGTDPGEITRQTTRSFVDGVGAQMGINVGFYDTTAAYGGLYTDLNYIAASNGNVYSTSAGKEAMFNIGADNSVKIGIAGPAGSTTLNNGVPANLYNASGGNQRILNGGAVSAPDNSYTNTLNPHTAFGASQDNRYVFLATVDGRQTGYSEGMYTSELAQVMLSFGAYNAINLDGGGSTTMVMDDDGNTSTHNSRLVNSPSDGSSGAQAGAERVVANSLAVFATPNASYVPLPAVPRAGVDAGKTLIGTTTVFDSFDKSPFDTGHFGSAPNASGSSHNVASNSTATLDSTYKHAGAHSLKLNLVSTDASPGGTQCRFLSGGGTPSSNVTSDDRAMGNTGYVGVYLRMDPGSTPLFVSMLVDDGTVSSSGTEQGSFFQIIADGEFHLYQWNLDEDGHWTNFAGGNGVIDGPNVFVDSLLFSGTNANTGGPNVSGAVWIDSLTYNPTGPIEVLPEPATLSAFLAGAGMLLGRRRA